MRWDGRSAARAMLAGAALIGATLGGAIMPALAQEAAPPVLAAPPLPSQQAARAQSATAAQRGTAQTGAPMAQGMPLQQPAGAMGGAAGGSPAGSADMAGYTLGPGDHVRITVFNEPSLSGDYGINDDGEVVVSLVGAIKVAGKSPVEAGEMLRAALANGYLNDPKVSLELLSYRPFYILGEVGKPGAYPYVNNLTITQAIAFAGGYSYRANRRTVFLKRRGAAAEVKVKVRTDDQLVGAGDVIRVGERYF